MAVRLISVPFRLTPSGQVATVDQGGDGWKVEHAAKAVLTRRGARELVPAYGVPDPVFAGLSAGELNACLTRFGPPIRAAIDVVYPEDGTAEATVAVSDVV